MLKFVKYCFCVLNYQFGVRYFALFRIIYYFTYILYVFVYRCIVFKVYIDIACHVISKKPKGNFTEPPKCTLPEL